MVKSTPSSQAGDHLAFSVVDHECAGLVREATALALRLARFNANIDSEEQPHKSAGFLTGVPAPAGAGPVAGAVAEGARDVRAARASGW